MQTIRDIGTQRVLTSMTLLAGLTSFMIGNAYHAQMPGFADRPRARRPRRVLQRAAGRRCRRRAACGHRARSVGTAQADPRTAIVLAILWSLSLFAFASVGIYALAIALLFAAGFFELSFNTMAQALVQLNAPAEIRGRVVGLFNMAGLGMRAFSGITVGLARRGDRHSLVARPVGRRAVGVSVRPVSPRDKIRFAPGLARRAPRRLSAARAARSA